MKRGKPLERRTPLKARKQLQNTPLKAARQLLRRAPLKQVSARRVKENQTRAKVVAELKARQVETAGYVHCQRCGTTRGEIHGHELRGRAQSGSITDPANIRLACIPCNEWAEDNPEAAAAEGWKISGKYPKEN